jgi:Golgi phosphoprotein 3 (GPP34)
MDVLDSLGEDLALLSVSPDGKVTTAQQIGFGLMGSELVRLAAAGKITIAAGRVDVIDQSPGLDSFLDAALASLDGSRRGVRAKAWVSHPRRGITEAYLERLAAAGVLQAERGTRLGIFPVTRWRVTDAGRQAQARARLDAVALSAGPVGTAQAALGGLAHAAGLGAVLYPGRANRQARARLERIAKGSDVAPAVADAGSGAADGASQAMAAANQAAVSAATAAATQATIDAATSAAVAAATDAASSAAHGAHGAGGAHGGH